MCIRDSQKLIEQIRRGAFHIPQLLKNILQPGQDLRQIAFVRHAAAEGIGQKPGEHIAGIGFGRVGGADVSKRQSDCCTSISRHSEFDRIR